jgi:hypothetical protein
MSSRSPSHASARTSVLVALGALLLVLGVAPFVPRGGDDEGGLLPSGGDGYAPREAATAGLGRLTPELRAEVGRVVARGRALGRELARASHGRGERYAALQVAAYVRCAEFEGQRYCLGTGWTEDTEEEVQARTVAAVRTDRGRRGRSSGDLDARAALVETARMSVDERARAERAELTMAARSVAKVWLLRHELEGVPLPAGFLGAHPEARAETARSSSLDPTGAATITISPLPSATPTSASPTTNPTTKPTTTTPYEGYPESATVLDKNQVAEQERNYWCGPTAMQMIAWGWKAKYRSQDHWARVLGTTSSGTDMRQMIRTTNQRTGWDRPDYAGPYIALDIRHYTFDAWQLLLMKHVVDLRSPVILHVQLLKEFFPYLDHDGSGHFQVGRGYAERGAKPDLIGYFEPWNQQRFHPDEPFIARLQWRQSYRTYRATLAHYQHNVGV